MDEATGEEEALGEFGVAVGVATRLGFASEVEGAGGLCAGEQVEGLLGVAVVAIGLRCGGRRTVSGDGLDLIEQVAAVSEAVGGNIGGKADAGEIEVGLAGIAEYEEGIVLFAHASAGLAGDAFCLSVELKVPRKDDRGRESWFVWREAIDERGEGGPVFGEGLVGGGRTEVIAAGEHLAAGGSVDRHVVGHGAEQCEAIHLLREEGEVFAEMDVGDGGLDGIEVAADFGGRGGLHVPEVDVTGTAEEENENAGIVPMAGGGIQVGVFGGKGAELGELGK